MNPITKEMKVAEVFESYPTTQGVFKKFGFGALLNPLLRKSFGRVTSIERACKHHGVPLNEFLDALNRSFTEPVSETNPESEPQKKVLFENTDEMLSLQNILSLNVSIITHRWPEVQKVFTKHFGEGCFSCPGFGMEDVKFACSMHNTDPILFAKECLTVIKDK